MAFAVGAAHAPSLNGWLAPGLTPRMEQGKYPLLVTRNESTTRNNTVNLFIDALGADYEYAASVVTACAGQTIYALQCTAANQAGIPTEACGPNAMMGRLTVGQTTYAVSTAISTRTMGYDATVTIDEHCILGGTTAATCTATAKATVDGKSTAGTTTTIMSGTDYRRYDVEITGGAEKTVNAAATCAPTSTSAGASVKTKARAIWALAGVFGIFSVLAM